MYERHEFGKIGEALATRFLQEKGYEIIRRNFMCRQGEIDIIAKDKNEFVFVEVKTRQNLKYGSPSEAVNEKKRNHIWKAAQYYIYINNLDNEFIRFDVIEIYKPNNEFLIKHIKRFIG